MPKRMIDAEIFDSDLSDLPLEDCWLFLGLVVEAADDQGRFEINASRFRRRFLRGRGVTDDGIREALGRLAANESLILYKVDGVEYGQAVNWWKYQMHQWATPSKYPPPEGWKDRIRYQASGAANTVVTFNWEKRNGEMAPDTCDCRGRPLMEPTPPKEKSPPDEPAAGPGNHHQGEHRTHEDDSTPPDFRQEGTPSGLGSPLPVGLGERQDQDQDQDQDQSTRVTEGGEGSTDNDLDCVEPAHGTPQASPPLWMPTASDRQWLNRPEQQYLDGLKRQVAGLGLDMAIFRSLVDHILDKHGKIAIARLETADGVQALRKAQECVLALLVTDKAAYGSTDGIETIYASWMANDWRSPTMPRLNQLVEHAGLMTKGVVVNEKDRANTGRAGNNTGRTDRQNRRGAPNQESLGAVPSTERIAERRARAAARRPVQLFN